MSGVTFSVIIPVKNGASTLPDQLDALLGQQWPEPGEIVVVDNGSTDETVELVHRFGESHRSIRLCRATRRGPSAARNAGAAAARGELLLFCDADDVVGPQWVASMVNSLGRCSVVTGPIEVDTLNPTWLADAHGRSHLGELPNFYGVFVFAQSCNLGIQARTFCEAGGFDESLSAGEDIEFGLRLWKQSVPVSMHPGAVVSYRYRATARERWRQGITYGAAVPVIARRVRNESTLKLPVGRLSGLHQWAWLARNAMTLRSGKERAHWQWVASQRVGRLLGSIRAQSVWI